jgi:hypothetical protein
MDQTKIAICQVTPCQRSPILVLNLCSKAASANEGERLGLIVAVTINAKILE